MIEINSELISAMQKYSSVFGDIVPLRELPSDATNEELINIINESIEKNIDLLPEKYGFDELDKNKNILI